MQINKVIPIVAIGVAVVVIGLTVFGLVSGRLVVVSQSSQVVVAPNVCDTAVVNTYNDAMFYTTRNGSLTASLDQDGLKKLETEVKAKAGSADDPTCQVILFNIAVINSNYDAAKKAYDIVKELHDKRIFADSNLRGNQPLFVYDDTIKSLSPDAQRTLEGMGDNS